MEAQEKSKTEQKYLVGVISDTHGLLRHEVLECFDGCDLIVHAGDIGNLKIMEALEEIAPTIAVRGNCDRGEVQYRFPETNAVEVGDVNIYLIHDLNHLDISPHAGFDVIISGHTHRPLLSKKDGVLFLNPGSAGPRRFNLPIGVAKLYIEDGKIEAELIEL